MFDHIEFTVENIDASHQFYRPVIEAIGFHEVFVDEDARAACFGISLTVQHLLLTEGKMLNPGCTCA